VAAIVPYGDVERRLRHFDEMRLARLKFDYIWQDTADYIIPRRDFSITQQMGWLRPRRVTSNVAPNANDRMAALVLSYLVDPTRPFLLPNTRHRRLVRRRRRRWGRLQRNSCGRRGRPRWDHRAGGDGGEQQRLAPPGREPRRRVQHPTMPQGSRRVVHAVQGF